MSLCLCGGIVSALADDNPTVPGELVLERPTLRSLGFHWFVKGDANGNATVKVQYRRRGAMEWKAALPMMRIHDDTVDRAGHPVKTGNLFAGSVLSLQPDTPYEVSFTLHDPDGGHDERVMFARTRPEPAMRAGAGREIHVYPSAFGGGKQEPSFPDLDTACKQARAGDIVLLHAGAYRGSFRVVGSGTFEKPIVFRPAGDGAPVIIGLPDQDRVFDVQGNDYVWFEGLTIRHAHMGMKANGAKGLVVRGCKIDDVDMGIIGYTPDAQDWYIADNVITGRVQRWYPRVESDNTGVSCAGTGMVVCHNRISRFWDCVSTDNIGGLKQEWVEQTQPFQSSIDICNNDISEALDDGIEMDDTLYNVRVFDNRVMNTHTGVSAQPVCGGPLYVFRNLFYNTTYTPFKLHNYPTGLVIVNNTAISARQPLESWPPAWRNGFFRNNLLLGTGKHSVETGSPDRRTSLDYDGIGNTHGKGEIVKWSADEGKTWGAYKTVGDFASAAGQERHGVLVDYDVFVRAVAPVEGTTYSPIQNDFDLKPTGAAIDAGVEVPTITDGFRGKAPDLGCCESGAEKAIYGPRPRTPIDALPGGEGIPAR